MMDELKSKKWRTMLLTLAAMMFQEHQNAPWYVVASVAVVACVYLAAQGLADQGKSRMQVLVDAVERGVIDGKGMYKTVQAELADAGVEEKTDADFRNPGK